jgi:hypothetical protein
MNFIPFDPLLEAGALHGTRSHPLDPPTPCISISLKSIEVKTSLKEFTLPERHPFRREKLNNFGVIKTFSPGSV